jgi:hypothetical protein
VLSNRKGPCGYGESLQEEVCLFLLRLYSSSYEVSDPYFSGFPDNMKMTRGCLLGLLF